MVAKTKHELKVTLPSDTEVRLERSFDAPRALVFKAMTDREHLKEWWGFRTSTLEVIEHDLRPGGKWRFVSRADDGTEHPFCGEFREIVAPEKIVQTFCYDVPPMNEAVAVETMTLTEQTGRTTLVTLSRYPSKEARDGHVQAGMETGAAETMDRLEELVAKLA